jgi:hypothetical protein
MLCNSNTSKLVAHLKQTEFELQEKERNGEYYSEGELRPPDTHVMFVSDADEQAVRDTLKKLALSNFEALLKFEHYKELPGKKIIFSPIKTHHLEGIYRILKTTTKRIQEHDPVYQELIKILKAISRQPGEKVKDPDDFDIVLLPRILVIDLRKEDQSKFPIILNEMNPAQLRQSFDNQWEDLLNEIPKKFRTPILKAMEEAIANTKDNQPEPTQGLLADYVRDGLYHEAAHPLSVNLTLDMEKEFFKLAMVIPKGRLFFKNMLKALLGIYKYRQRFLEVFPESTYRTKALMMYMFGSEMFADYFAIFMKEQVSQEHVYTHEYGEQLTPELRVFFGQKTLPHFQSKDKIKRSLVFTYEEQNQSKMYQAQQITAGLGIEVDNYR